MALDLALTDDGYNQRVGRYGFTKDAVTGDVAFDETQAFAVMTSVACRRKRYWANVQHGTDIGDLKNVTQLTPSPTPSQAQAQALSGMTPLADAGLITNPQASATLIPGVTGKRSVLSLSVSWNLPGSTQPISRTLPQP